MSMHRHCCECAPCVSGEVKTLDAVQSLEAVSATRNYQFLVDYSCSKLQSSAAHAGQTLPRIISQEEGVYRRCA